MEVHTRNSIDEIISWDEAVGSRLVEMAGDNIINFRGDKLNYRLKYSMSNSQLKRVLNSK